MASPKRVALQASTRTPLRGAREIGPANADERIEVTLRLHSKAGKKPALSQDYRQLPAKRQILSREQLEAQHGADAAGMAKVQAFAQEHGLAVVEIDLGRRTVILSGTVAAMNQAFGVELKLYEYDQGTYRGRTGQVHIPADLEPYVEGVFGLDNRPQAKPHFRRQKHAARVHAEAKQVSYTPLDLAKLYDFPNGVDGSGECIGILELGGGYKPADLTAYFKQLQISKPQVSPVSVNHAHNAPTGNPNGADGEVMLDIEVAGAVAPGAKIVIYFAPNTDAGFLNAITTAIHDKKHNPSVLSISWGGPESNWTQQAMTAMDDAFQSAAAVGMTVCCAAGDDGSTDGVDDKLNHVDFPASSPNVLACGGTKLVASNNHITSETVWNELQSQEGATGGGISDVFELPTWQQDANVPTSANPDHRKGRGVPDVSGDADPSTGYETRVDGQPDVIGGTSAVAPLWSGLIARINQALGKPVGFLNPLLYQNVVQGGGFRDITGGSNGAYPARKGWDACTGNGTPIGTAIAAALGAQPAKKAKKTGT
jgi:kumamolisin